MRRGARTLWADGLGATKPKNPTFECSNTSWQTLFPSGVTSRGVLLPLPILDIKFHECHTWGSLCQRKE